MYSVKTKQQQKGGWVWGGGGEQDWTHLDIWSVAFCGSLKGQERQTGLLATSDVHSEDVSCLLSDDANHMFPLHWHVLQLVMIIIIVGKVMGDL